MKTWAVVVAAGRGDRFGSPKQFELLGPRRLVDWAAEAAAAACDGVVVVVPGDAEIAAAPAADAIVAGGASRSDSVRAGLAAVPLDADVIVVHDAARPLAPASLFSATIGAVAAGADAAVPGLPVADTLKEVDGAVVVATVARDRLVAVQTPQAFRASRLRSAHAAGGDATDDAALVEAAGGTVVWVAGDARAMKVTTPEDLHVARAMLDG